MKKKKQGKPLKNGIIAIAALLAIGAAAGDKNDSQTTSQITEPPAKVSDLPQSTKQEEEISTTTKEPLVSEIETNTIEEQPKTEENNSVAEISTQNNTTNSNNNFNTYNNVSQQQTSDSYVLNSGTYKFHYPSCDSVAQIAPQNYSTSNSSRSEIMAQGYKPCGRCNP